MAKSGRLELGDNIYGHYGLQDIQPLWRIWPAKQSNPAKKSKIRAIGRSRSFKVIEVDTNRKPVCDFLLVIWQPISTVAELSQLIVQVLDTLRFWDTLWGAGLGTTYDVHLGLIAKHVLDFLLVIIDLFSLGAIRTKIDGKSAISL